MKKCTKKWTMRDGTKIRICDMEDSHLRNTSAMLQRHSVVTDEAIWGAMSFAASCRGDMATYVADQMVDDLLNGEPREHPLYEDLVNELERRERERNTTTSLEKDNYTRR